ncbi:MAG TPA: PQQ-binding-like beta-propeller repeat protein [Candidatus Polarisedimenticolaceae bacterium]|nr:PQQ-binding-like beta-propeller repeat protein [Candidatus Polarisedimenticolaceae bacterium]
MRRGAFSGVAGLLAITWTMVAIVAVPQTSAADKPPASSPVWATQGKYDLNRLGVGAEGKVVYARDGKHFTGLSTEDGKQKYQRELPGFEEKGWWGHVSDATYVYSNGKELIGIDIATGTDRWHASPGEGIKTDAFVLPRRGNPKAMMFAFESGVSVWDIDPGKLLWSAREPLDYDMVPDTWAREGDQDAGVLMFLKSRTVYVGANGKELWSAKDTGNRRRGGKDVANTAVVDYGRLLLVYLSKQVILLNNATGEVLASQTFPNEEAAADVEAFKAGGEDGNEPVLLTLGGRAVLADPKEGKVFAQSPEGSILGQAAGGAINGDDMAALTAVRGGDRSPNVGLHLYRINLKSGAVAWHAYNGQILDNRQIMGHIVGERVNGPFYLDKAKGVFLATSDKGARLYNWDDGKERWALDEGLPNSYRVMKYWGHNSFSIIRTMMQNRTYVPTNPAPVEGDGVIYAAGNDQIFAIDASTGKAKWTSKSKNLSLVSGLANSGGSIIVRQGIHADANDYGAPVTIVTQPLERTYVEEPEVYIDESPYGFVGLDPATGKESWSCTDFESHDYEFVGGMPKDNSICSVQAKAKKEKGCKLSKLGVGSVLYTYSVGDQIVYLGKSGMAGAVPGSCAPAWSVDGAVKKQEKIYDFTADDEDHTTGFLQKTSPAHLFTHYGNNVNVVDTASGKVILSAGKADVVKLYLAQKMVFAADGEKLAMYRLP